MNEKLATLQAKLAEEETRSRTLEREKLKVSDNVEQRFKLNIQNLEDELNKKNEEMETVF